MFWAVRVILSSHISQTKILHTAIYKKPEKYRLPDKEENMIIDYWDRLPFSGDF